VNTVYYACPICGEPKKGRGRSDRILCKTCSAKARWRSDEHRKKIHIAAVKRFGAEIPWKYVNFTDEIKELVRARDGRVCIVCGVPENGMRLDVHHIDYNKANSTPQNLVALCHSCHMRTCNNREYWKRFFLEAIS
jgi:5-methylcytosine-specific restriction endonuclease McrA